MPKNPEKLNYPVNQEDQQEIKEHEPFLRLIFIDDDIPTTDTFEIVFNKQRLIKDTKVICKTFNVYNRETVEYLQQIKEDKNQFVVVDLRLENKREGGLGVIKDLQEMGYKGKIFLLTGIDGREIKYNNQDIKIDRIIQKPICTEKLCEIIASYLK